MNLDEINKIVKENLSEARYYHSICTMHECEKLAQIYTLDIEKAKKVGLAHDIAKEMSEAEKIRYVEENHILMDEVERIQTGLLHAKIGADIGRKRFGFTADMCKAVEAHTTRERKYGHAFKNIVCSRCCW